MKECFKSFGVKNKTDAELDCGGNVTPKCDTIWVEPEEEKCRVSIQNILKK